MAISISSSLPWSRSLAGGEVEKGHNPLQSAQRSISAEASAWIRSLSLATAVFHSEEPRNISPPFQEGGETKKGEKKGKSLVSTLPPTRRALCLASAPLFVINLHGVMFALAGVVAGQQLACRHHDRLLCWRTGRGRILLAPCGIGEEMLSLWEAAGGGTPSSRVWDVEGCLLHSKVAISALVAGAGSWVLSLQKSITPWSTLALAGTRSTWTNGSFPL